MTISNCEVKNTTVYGKNKVGGMIGCIADTATLSITGDQSGMNNVTVNTSEGEAAMVIGCVYVTPTVTIAKDFKDWVTSCSLNLVQGKYQRDWIDVSNKDFSTQYQTATQASAKKDEWTDGQSSTFTDGTTLVSELDGNGKPEDSNYRIFIKDAYMIIQANGETNVGTTTVGGVDKGTIDVGDLNITKYGVFGGKITVNGNTYNAKVLHAIK